MKKLIFTALAVIMVSLSSVISAQTHKCDIWLSSNVVVEGAVTYDKYGKKLTLHVNRDGLTLINYSEISLKYIPDLSEISIIKDYAGNFIPVVATSKEKVSKESDVEEHIFKSLIEGHKGAVKGFIGNTAFLK